MNKKFLGISLFALFVLATFVNAVNIEGQKVNSFKAYVKGGNTYVTGTYYDNRANPVETGTIEAYCLHNNQTVLIGAENFSLAMSSKGLQNTFYIKNYDRVCIKGDKAWVEINDFKSQEVDVKKKHGKKVNNIVDVVVLTPNEQALLDCKNDAETWYNSTIKVCTVDNSKKKDKDNKCEKQNHFTEKAYSDKLEVCQYNFEKAECEDKEGMKYEHGKCVVEKDKKDHPHGHPHGKDK